ncbi:hypothetical protein Pint_20963 [Pistacia integerrima]|uniref:Uncharacterized protein n=3 Tax=Pistacia TaxID=55512 RepID=A0ACC1A8H9_9ROSI|nr:hypothetical protein Pint_36713 [Pistacia integerrima]KAJ0010015.1 hypothetical protein Pint_33203 [Pistacia integerrima]KAJ0015139.1 hypothetical protein Pint_20963 [Pistacia integerrima]KAJ0083538.1 hypothetical protein Patl1_29682 [Pistacia atlantica]
MHVGSLKEFESF